MREYHHPSPTKEPIDRHHYGGQWVAILRRRIIDHDRDLDALCDRLERVGLEDKAMLMKVPPPGIVLI
ncbi:MAG TPA: DUF5678 domain-containing protein [Candidatus Thermoplasmatota archaeon]|nr:DUF5678 domain-containing protein [Candidatus Thermoplasmatota archaeon]